VKQIPHHVQPVGFELKDRYVIKGLLKDTTKKIKESTAIKTSILITIIRYSMEDTQGEF